MLHIPPSPFIRAVQVSKGFDVADNHIAEQVSQGDLVITADIPLAAAVIDKHALALNPRGEFYSRENIREALDMRNFMDILRSTGVETGGPSAFSNSDRQNFAKQLDRFLAGHFGCRMKRLRTRRQESLRAKISCVMVIEMPGIFFEPASV